jgi:holliday junction DNA helicase RuvB
MDEDRIVNPQGREEDVTADKSLRPRNLRAYIGQEKVVDNLKIAITAAKGRGEPLDHILFYGPPGLGKTTLAMCTAVEMGVSIRITSGPAIERAGDLAAILTNLKKNDLLFIDDVHRLNRAVEEVLYPAMEDFALDIVVGKGPSARSLRIKLPRFTVVGATTRLALLTSPLRDRFGAVHRLEFYSQEAMEQIVTRAAGILATRLEPDAGQEIARRSRGTPRIALRILKRVRDWAQVTAGDHITLDVAREALDRLEVDELGLDPNDRRVLRAIIDLFDGGPVGLSTLGAATSEEVDAIEDVYEPFLIQLGFIRRTPRGRVATRRAYEHLGIPYTGRRRAMPAEEGIQESLW